MTALASNGSIGLHLGCEFSNTESQSRQVDRSFHFLTKLKLAFTTPSLLRRCMAHRFAEWFTDQRL